MSDRKVDFLGQFALLIRSEEGYFEGREKKSKRFSIEGFAKVNIISGVCFRQNSDLIDSASECRSTMCHLKQLKSSDHIRNSALILGLPFRVEYEFSTIANCVIKEVAYDCSMSALDFSQST